MVISSDTNIKDYSISFVRLVAMLFIVFCHIFQFYSMEIAQWFNVGVQMFLFISGFLYGKRQYSNKLKFILRNVKKILIDYYVFLLLYLGVYYLAFQQTVSVLEFLNLIFCRSTAKGIEHLWFVQIIIICYILTPFMADISDKISNSKKHVHLMHLLLLFFLNFGLAIALYLENAIWITCYFIGFLCRRYNCDKENKTNVKIVKFVCSFAVLLNLIIIATDYIAFFSIYSEILYRVIFAYGHVFLGISLFYCFSFLFNRLNYENGKMEKILDISDKISYDVYLVHHMWIIGPASILQLNISPVYKLVLLFSCVCFFSILVNKTSIFINQKLFKNMSVRSVLK